MLPTSHLAPINAPSVGYPNDDEGHHVAGLQFDEGRGPQKRSEDELDMQARSAVLLASEFSDFISAASRLENSYRDLQEQVSELGLELSERNAALNTSLAENERMRLALQQIVDSMPCGVLVLDGGGEISMINPESDRLLGLNDPHLRAECLKTLRQISAVSGVNLEASYDNTSSSETEQEFCVGDRSGKRWIEVRTRRLFHQSGVRDKPDQTILILRDVTAQKRLEHEREAGRNAMALAEITTILAHEIRNPLASLELFAGLIEQDGDRRGEWISHLRAGIRSLSGTVNNVLSFHGSGSLKLAPVRLSALIDNAIQFVQPIANQASVSLKWSVDHNQTPIMGNQGALQQIVLNLVTNAIRYTPAGGSVTVALRPEQSVVKGESHDEVNEHIVAEFCDTGCGIRPDQIDHVFEPGFSGSGDTSGLGLAVCAQIMKQHGGWITATNRIQSGAVFALHFPVLESELETA